MDQIPMVDLRAAWAEIADEVEPLVLERLRSGDYLGSESVAAFEREWAAYVGGGVEAVACSSGTDAVELAVRATTEEEAVVAVPAETFVATRAAVERSGRCVVQDYAPPIGEPRLGAIARIGVWLYGSTANADQLAKECAIDGSILLEDVSQAHGNKRAGTIGDAAAWSLYPSKNLGAAGQAGVVTFKDSIAAAKARRIREHGYCRKQDRHFGRGFNMRMDGIQADILRVKLRRLDGWVARRREIAARYCSELRGVEQIKLPELEPDHAWHLFVVRVEDSARTGRAIRCNRDSVLAGLRERGIGAAVHYRTTADGRETEWSRSVLSLPLYPQMTDAQVERVVEAVKQCV